MTELSFVAKELLVMIIGSSMVDNGDGRVLNKSFFSNRDNVPLDDSKTFF